ncbi:MAG: RIP metalloprotease RseP [Candidatus Omnitrophica bacterium]|nr:RIP metalloprotease RseP [Candidatus Omnitrophota bacterium]
MFYLVIYIVILSILIIAHELGHFIMAKRMGVKVEIFSLGFGQKIFSFKRKDTEYALRLLPLGGYVKLAGDNWEEYKGLPDEYLSKSLKARLKILVAGSGFNYLLAILCLWLVFYLGYPRFTTKVGEVLKDMPAEASGIQPEDKILSVDNQNVTYWDDLQKIIQKKGGATVSISILRNNETKKVDVAVQKKEITTIWGEKQSIGLIGIVPAGEVIKVRHGFIKAFFLSIQRSLELTYVTLKGIVWLVLRKISIKESVAGPVGIFFIAQGAIKMGILAVFHVMAVLSLSLSIVNLLPLPILDGGHIVLLGMERIKGRLFIKKFDPIWTKAGLTFIIALALFVFYNDLVRFGVFEKIAKWFIK